MHRHLVGRGWLVVTLVLVTAATVVLQTVSASRSSRVAWSVTSLVVTALLLVVAAVEVLGRVRGERLEARADRALMPSGRSAAPEDEEPLLPALLRDLAACVAAALGAPSGRLELDGYGPPVPPSPDAGAGAHRLTTTVRFEGEALGTLEVVGLPGHRFGSTDRRLFRILAVRVADRVERGRLADAERRLQLGAEHARRRVDVLARSVVPLAPALEHPEEAIKELATIVVPDFADLFAVDLLREGGDLERIVVAHREPAMAASFAEHRPRFPDWQDTLRRVMAEGASELAFVHEDGGAVSADAHAGLMEAQGLRSWVVAPIAVRGVPVGTMTVATRERRGLRPSDQVTVDDLVARSAMALERGVLYHEARRAARDALELADKLTRLVAATIVVTGTLEPADLLPTLVEQATGVLEASHARVRLDEDGGGEIEWGSRPAGGVGISSLLADHHGRTIGRLTVERPLSEPFAPGDEAVLSMLAGSASVAEHNAALYHDLQAREQRLQALVEASPLAILELEETGAVHVANPAAQALFPPGEDGGDALVRPPPEFMAGLAGLVSPTVRGERMEVELVTTDGTGGERHLLVSTAPVGGEGSVRMLVVITDMTVRKRLEEQLAEAQRYEAIATLAGGVAHDFNNLLTVILGYSDLLLGVLGDATPEREQVEAIQEAGNHAAVITNQLLTLSRHQVLHPETIDPAARCTALVPMLRRLVGEGITIEYRHEEGSRIKVDPGQLEQVLFNLVLNARDAMSGGGHVDIDVAPRRLPGGEATVTIRVADDGDGMAPDTLARCREPFFTTKGRSRGIGLGLATVASILQRSGGALEITSEAGRGTCVTAVFPAVGGAEDGATAPAGPERARVLLVDDDEAVRRLTARVLVQAGYLVTEVDDGESAVARAGAGEFDLLVTDVVLPAMSGFELVREVGKRWPALPCLLITGYAGTETPADDVGETPLVTKPFTPEELLRAVADALRAGARGAPS